MIEKHPSEVKERSEFGHWESDAMVSRQSKAVLNVLVERMSRFTKLTKLARNTAQLTQDAIVRRLRVQRGCCRRSITDDNGSENSNHEKINQLILTQSYFCNPYHRWKKGKVENTNGLVRRFIPKKMDLERIPTIDIIRVENLLNNRPRKCLNYQTPKETFQRLEHLTGALAGCG